MKCANCPADAAFEYKINANNSTFFCVNHVPKFLQSTKFAGRMVRVEVDKSSKKKTTKAAETAPEPVVEEPPVAEEAPVEAPVETPEVKEGE